MPRVRFKQLESRSYNKRAYRVIGHLAGKC